jgi:soluble lytic murein transglycosylase-like protein
MKPAIAWLVILLSGVGWARSPATPSQAEAEYYAAAYAEHYRLPLHLVRSIIQQESGWQPCAISPKGAAGLMQLMPRTAERFGVTNRCEIKQNISGGVRYLAWLNQRFHGDYRLVAAAYYAGEQVVGKHGLNYRNRDVVAYVCRVRAIYEQQQRASARKESIR